MSDEGQPDNPLNSLRASNSLDAVAPVVLFLVLNRLVGLRWAVAGATLWSLKVVVDRGRRGVPLGRFFPLLTVAVIGRGVIGIVSDSEALYFGLGIATKYLVAVALIGSVVVGAPLGVAAARSLFAISDETRQNPTFRSTMGAVTAIGALYYLLSATFDIWLYRRSSVDGYVIVRLLVNWPLSAAAALAALALMRHRLRHVTGLNTLGEILGLPPSTAV